MEFENKKSNKGKVIAISFLMIVLVFLAAMLFIYFSSAKRAERRLNALAETFYKYYYEDNSSKDDKDAIIVFLSKYANSGLTIKLGDLEAYLDTHKVEDYSALKKCNTDKTKVTVYPKAPYGKKDYKVELKMSCTF